jgi:hypothetical protein
MRSLRFLAYFLGITLFLVFLGGFLAPTFLSSQTLRERALPWIASATGAQIEVEKLQLSWFHDQEIKGLRFKTKGLEFNLDSLRLQSPLWKVFIPGKDLDLIEIKKPFLIYELDSLVQRSSEQEKTPEWLAFLLHPLKLDLHEGYLQCLTAEHAVLLENLNCQARFISLDQPLDLSLKAQSISGLKRGSVELDLHIERPAQWLASLDADIQIQDFPLEITTAFVQPDQAQLLYSWSREPLNLNVKFKRRDHINDCFIQLSCAPLKTKMQLCYEHERLYLKEAAPISLLLKKEEINSFLQFKEPLRLHSDFWLNGSLESFHTTTNSLQNSEWALKAQTREIKYERRSHQAALSALSFTATCQESLYSLQIDSLENEQVHAHLQIGPEFQEKDLKKANIALSGITLQDLLPWSPLPQETLAWVFPLKTEIQLDREKEELKGLLRASSNEFKSQTQLLANEKELIFSKGQFHLEKLNIASLNLNSIDLFLDSLRLPRDFQPEDFSSQMELKCKTLAVEQRLLKEIDLKAVLNQRQVALELECDLAKAKTKLELSPANIRCIEPVQVSAHLTPEEAKTWIQDIGFIEPVDLELEIQPASWSVDTPIENQWIEASAKVKPILIQKTKESPVIGIPATELQIRSNFNITSAHAMFYSVPSSEKNLVPATFKGQAQIRNKSLTKAQVQISELSTDWLDILVEAKGKLATLLGYTLAADVHIELSGKHPIIQLNAKTPHLKANFSWKQEEKWTLSKPAELHFQVPTKACIKILEGIASQNSGFELVQGLDFVTRIGKLETQDKDLELAKIQASGELFLKKAAIRKINQDRRNEIQELKVVWKFNGPSKTFEQHLSGHTQSGERYDGPTLSGKIEGKSRHENLFDKDQKLQWASAKHLIDLKANQLSSDWIDFAASFRQAKQFPLLSELLGPVFEIQSHVEIDKKTGPVELTFSSTFSHLKINGKCLDEVFTLNKPIDFELQPHPGLSRYFTGQGNSSSISSISTQEPIRVEVSEKNFSFPIKAFDMKKIQIDHLHATMGKIEWKNRGILHFFVNLLKWQQRGDSKTLTIEPLPIDLSMKEGIIYLQRSDALVAELFPVAAWGTIDLNLQKLNLTVGISKTALENALAIQDLPDGYLMLVPVHGALSNPAAEATLATTKIAALIARNSKSIVNQIAPTNPTGLIIGGILGAIMPLPDEKANVPPPRYPIPWQFVRENRSQP